MTETLIRDVVNSSQVPSGKRRIEIARELRAHIEDFVQVARDAGHSEEEICSLLIANFGNPAEIAEEFAAVYATERAIKRISVFLLATLVAASGISAVVLGLQATMAVTLGVPFSQVFEYRHLALETLFIFLTVAAYFGLLSLEKLFRQAGFGKALASLAGLFVVAGLFAPAPILACAFVSGALLRAMQLILKNQPSRMGAALAIFGGFGLMMMASRASPGLPNQAAVQIAVWLAIGACGHWTTTLSARVDRALSGRSTQT